MMKYYVSYITTDLALRAYGDPWPPDPFLQSPNKNEKKRSGDGTRCAPGFLKSLLSANVCVCVHVYIPEAINN